MKGVNTVACRVSDIIGFIENLAPTGLAAPWDNPGLQVGSRVWPVRRVWVALDALPEVVSRACAAKVDMLVTHHPLIFRPLKRVDVAAAEGAVIERAIRNRMAIYAAHTNLDAAPDGVNDILAAKIGLQDAGPLNFSSCEENRHLGRIGSLPKRKTLQAFARRIKKTLGVRSLKIAGTPGMTVKSVMVCCGSGSSLVQEFIASGADVFVSGDLRYHDARAVEAVGRGLVDLGHFASERVMIEDFAGRIGRLASAAGAAVSVEPYLQEKDPFVTV